MKKFLMMLLILAFSIPAVSFAADQKTVDQYGEDVEANPDFIEQVAPEPKAKPAVKKSSGIKEKDISEKKSVTKETPATTAPVAPVTTSTPTAGGRDGRFKIGLIAPGFGVANEGIGAYATFGLEGEYYIYEKISAGLRAELGTKFTRGAIMDFTPFARYTFDSDSHPRFAAYAQGGVGISIFRFGGSTNTAANIMIPGCGIWWQWTDKFSVGADTNLHIYVMSGTTVVGWTIAPTLKYLF